MARWSQAAADFLRVIFTHETLPPAPPSPAPSARRGPLALLFSPEPLPEDPPLPPRRRARWLAWLLAPERLDDDR